MKKYLLPAIIIVLCFAQAVNAQSVNFWLTRAGDTTPINAVNASVGSDFNLSVWCQTEGVAAGEMGVMVGFDRTSDYGVEAASMDSDIAFVGSSYAGAADWDIAWANIGGGTAKPGESIRPYGYNLALSMMSGSLDYSNPTKLFDITLKNVGVDAGEEYWIELWNAGTGYGGTTYAYDSTAGADYRDSTGVYNPASWAGQGTGWAVKVSSTDPVPEPSSVLALFSGLAGVAGITLRRRRIEGC